MEGEVKKFGSLRNVLDEVVKSNSSITSECCQ